MNPEAILVSFVVRFVHDDANGSNGAPSAWHGVIRHVQTNTERHFTRWPDAMAFMSQYVDLGAAIVSSAESKDAPLST